jgi:hypothetical protein
MPGGSNEESAADLRASNYHALTYTYANTCPNGWLYNYLYGGISSDCTSAMANNNNIIQHILDCANGTSCAGAHVTINAA